MLGVDDKKLGRGDKSRRPKILGGDDKHIGGDDKMRRQKSWVDDNTDDKTDDDTDTT